MTAVSLYWPDYQLLPYEREFALEEARVLLRAGAVQDGDGVLSLQAQRLSRLPDLTYFKAYKRGQRGELSPTVQTMLERNGTPFSQRIKRQATRYSVHGLHEYKGKFNPQIARAILNAADVKRGSVVFDPFCGSGTTLVEASHLGLHAFGADLNPLAAFIATTKLRALRMDGKSVAAIAADAKSRRGAARAEGAREDYLRRWFAPEVLSTFERIRTALHTLEPDQRDLGLVLASNLLREFSLQEPADLRIRRRVSPPSSRTPLEAFRSDVAAAAVKIDKMRAVLAGELGEGSVVCADARQLATTAEQTGLRGKARVAITSPPYAMALPYIDTQRLSLIWLGMVHPSDLPSLQSQLIGSREFVGRRDRFEDDLLGNTAALPREAWKFCRRLGRSVGPNDGFRRRSVPQLMYRYLVGMRDAFAAVAELLAPRGRFYLVVGHNHTTLGGTRIDIDTPALLAMVASETAFRIERTVELQTYQRYGLHHKNAVNREELLVMQRR